MEVLQGGTAVAEPAVPETGMGIGAMEDSGLEDGAAPVATETGAETPSAPEATQPVAATPVIPQKPPPPDPLDSMRQQLAQQQEMLQAQYVETQRIQSQYQQQQDINELAAWQQQLAAKYEPEVVDQLVRQRADLMRQRRGLVEAQTRQAQQLAAQQQNMEAKVKLVNIFSAQSGMPTDLLMTINDPYVMEATARAYKAEQELAKARQAQVKPTTLAGVSPGGSGMSKRALTEKYITGGTLTPAEMRIVHPEHY